MKISIENFKSITKLQNFEIKPFTILSGINSAGKSSFVQLLLLLKQTVELDSLKNPFFLDGEFYKIHNFIDIISNKDLKRKLKISFEFNKSEIEQLDNLKKIPIFKTLGEYSCSIEIKYDTNKNNDIFISFFSIKFNFNGEKEQFIIIKSNNDSKIFSIETNTGIFGNDLLINNPEIYTITYSSIYPMFYESKIEIESELGNHKTKDIQFSKELIDIEDIKIIINSFLENISYLGPNREEPKNEYSFSKIQRNVGSTGEFVAQILEEEAKNITNYYEIEKQENGINYNEIDKTLAQATKYWMCDIFDVAEDIKTEKINEIYKIILVSKSGLETNIKHVGFGISQLLPIVVEGLRMPNNGTLIIEQPEIHLHPKIQSQLYDFLFSLILQGKKVIIETHSSHFITRMRRRIAEDESNKMDDIIGLTFIENDVFRSIELDDYGTMDYYPDDFIEQEDTELRAIVKAQMKKRMKNVQN
ncbi:MAG: AAA family ATPase [Candidatus Cloacimonetes bacterium]|nr:AAA family ATPase [Candidatus Cloacimonadota bacterium]